MERAVDTMTAIRLDDRAAAGLGVFLYDVTEVFEGDAGFDDCDCLVETFPSCLDKLHKLLVGERLVADIVGFIEVAMVAFMVESDVQVEDVAVEQDSLIRNAMANHFVWRRAYRFGEVVVIER